MSDSVWWALSCVDWQAHLLVSAAEQPRDVLMARCGHVMPAKASDQHAQPAGGRHRTCPACAVIAQKMSEPPVLARGRNRLVIPGTCRACMGQMAVEFTNVVVSRLPDGQIEFDPHATGTHPFTVGEDSARRLVERVAEWLG